MLCYENGKEIRDDTVQCKLDLRCIVGCVLSQALKTAISVDVDVERVALGLIADEPKFQKTL